MRTRFVPARLELLVALGLLLAPGVAMARFGEKPKPPVSGEPLWTQSEESKRVHRAQVKAVKLYIKGLRDVEEANGRLYRSTQLAAMAAKDPESGEKSGKMRKSAQEYLRKARKTFIQATKLDPKNADAWNMLGYTILKSGETDLALDAFAKALALKPEHFGAHENTAEARLAQGRVEDARAELAWLKQRGNMTTLETNNLQTAINLWVAANPGAGSKGDSGKL
jgi:Flp pilus assembly protein TadD